MVISREDFAKYPFIKEANDYVKKLDLNIDELDSFDYVRVRNRAEQRVNEALTYNIVKPNNFLDKEIELLSFPVAVLFVAKIGDDFLKRRYSLAEAKRAYEILKNEDERKLVEIARSTFSWRIRIEGNEFFVSLVNYLRNTSGFHENSWKLVNRIVVGGEVILKKGEVVRLLQEDIRRHVENIINKSPKVTLSPSLKRSIERINLILNQRREEIQIKELPKSAISAAYPPCIKRLYDLLLAGQHISHIGRFTLTSFLLNVGIKPDDLTKLYMSISDFDENLTQYQVKHIAGEKGSKIKYIPPNCNTLKTHSLCLNIDDLCKKIRNPLSYYRGRLKLIERFSTEES